MTLSHDRLTALSSETSSSLSLSPSSSPTPETSRVTTPSVASEMPREPRAKHHSSSPSVRGEKRKSKKGSGKRGHGVLRGLFLSLSLFCPSLCAWSVVCPSLLRVCRAPRIAVLNAWLKSIVRRGKRAKVKRGFEERRLTGEMCV